MQEFVVYFYKTTNIIDIVYLIITIFTLIGCYRRGFVLSILSMAKWFLAYVITLIIFPKAKPYLKGIIDNEYVLDIILGITIFVIVIFLILFNNLLQSLFKSQILTLGLVMIGIFGMFVILFKNIKLSLIGVVPNFIAAFFILGIIGLIGIPLDMMTITIAAITIGIAVDNSIHDIYRFKEEFSTSKDYNKTLILCHSTVGKAILNTSITIVFGFSILVLSKFIPTIYFGVFTGLAMLLAMILVLTLLPSLILLIKPFSN